MKKLATLLTLFSLLSSLGFASAFEVSEMTVEEKVGQLLLVHFNGEQANEDAQILIQQLHVGGIIYYTWANGLHSPDQVRSLSQGLQELASTNNYPIPLLIAVDQEGGRVNRLKSGFTVFPGNAALRMADDPSLVFPSALATGQELKAVGININLAPVVDINSNPMNPIIGIRSFGDTAENVITYSKDTLEGYRQAGILSCLKHFPGHGDVDIDSHLDLPVLSKSKDQLLQEELRPFFELANLADVIMTAHIMLPAVDSKNCATLSKEVLDLLRNDIGFDGVVMTDSLMMEGLLKNCVSIDVAAIDSLNAGADILLLGGKQLHEGLVGLEMTVSDIQRIHHALIKAIKEGVIPEERLNQAVQRILDIKNRVFPLAEKFDNRIDSTKHEALASKIAKLAIRTSILKSLSARLDEQVLTVLAPAMLENEIKQSRLLELGKKNSVLFFQELEPSEEEIHSAVEDVKHADAVIVCVFNAWKNSQQSALIKRLKELDKTLILIILGDVLDVSLFPDVDLKITTFSPTLPSIQAAYECLQGLNP